LAKRLGKLNSTRTDVAVKIPTPAIQSGPTADSGPLAKSKFLAI
jgi:hypothetical protein